MASLICRVARLRSNCFRQSFSAFLGLSLRTTLVLVTSIGMVGMPASLNAKPSRRTKSIETVTARKKLSARPADCDLITLEVPAVHTAVG